MERPAWLTNRACKTNSVLGLVGCGASCSVFVALSVLGLLGAAGVGGFTMIFGFDRVMMSAGKLPVSIILPIVNTIVAVVSVALVVLGATRGGRKTTILSLTGGTALLGGFLILPRALVMQTANQLPNISGFPLQVIPAMALFWIGLIIILASSVMAHLRRR